MVRDRERQKERDRQIEREGKKIERHRGRERRER